MAKTTIEVILRDYLDFPCGNLLSLLEGWNSAEIGHSNLSFNLSLKQKEIKHVMKKISICAALKQRGRYASAVATMAFVLSGCVTVSGTYVVTATDSAGQPVASGRRMIAEGSSIYTVRNGICAAHPKSVVIIRDVKTSEELKGESPYQCR